MGENGVSRGRCVASPVQAVRGTRSRRGRSTARSGAALDAYVERRAARRRPAPGAGLRPGVRWFDDVAGQPDGSAGWGGVPAQPGAGRVAAEPAAGRPTGPVRFSEADARALHPARSGRSESSARIADATDVGADGADRADRAASESVGTSSSEPAGALPEPIGAVVAGRRPVRLTRRGRLVVFLLVLFVGALLGFLVATPGRAADPPKPPASAVVQPDDTLWSFAERNMPRWRPAAAVAELKRLNDLEGSVIHPGQRLKVPAAR